MASKAIFIGINRYADDSINDLSGARWDAVALHALFSDSIPPCRRRRGEVSGCP
jgi:hypothetical protein